MFMRVLDAIRANELADSCRASFRSSPGRIEHQVVLPPEYGIRDLFLGDAAGAVRSFALSSFQHGQRGG
jgi:hypothetical protein